MAAAMQLRTEQNFVDCLIVHIPYRNCNGTVHILHKPVMGHGPTFGWFIWSLRYLIPSSSSKVANDSLVWTPDSEAVEADYDTVKHIQDRGPYFRYLSRTRGSCQMEISGTYGESRGSSLPGSARPMLETPPEAQGTYLHMVRANTQMFQRIQKVDPHLGPPSSAPIKARIRSLKVPVLSGGCEFRRPRSFIYKPQIVELSSQGHPQKRSKSHITLRRVSICDHLQIHTLTFFVATNACCVSTQGAWSKPSEPPAAEG